MAGMNNYERMFFGDSKGHNAYASNDPDPFRRNPGLGGKFEGSTSLTAESSFIPLINNEGFHPPIKPAPMGDDGAARIDKELTDAIAEID
mmetsp:Transcript_929/g.945  ORF Transcript_929/g.945 Transcript_929/m.945 type:complete len:90 (+) Transcript_929:1397-1666(+)